MDAALLQKPSSLCFHFFPPSAWPVAIFLWKMEHLWTLSEAAAEPKDTVMDDMAGSRILTSGEMMMVDGIVAPNTW